MGKDKRPPIEIIFNVPEHIKRQFPFMSVRQRLRWLEEANAFVNKVIPLEKRALIDERFEVFLPAAKKRRRKKPVLKSS